MRAWISASEGTSFSAIMFLYMAVSSRVCADVMGLQRRSCSEYPEKFPEIRFLVLNFKFSRGGGFGSPQHLQQPIAAPLQICFRRP